MIIGGHESKSFSNLICDRVMVYKHKGIAISCELKFHYREFSGNETEFNLTANLIDCQY